MSRTQYSPREHSRLKDCYLSNLRNLWMNYPIKIDLPIALRSVSLHEMLCATYEQATGLSPHSGTTGRYRPGSNASPA